ncbi:hypothetical protein SAMN05216241_11543 [Limimonas halophila]|uniref:DUF1489 domain-containing protein n=1 Tax=Limimonas halophila TaxID=1082479 RepID=A0A1G7UN40_9PROT|nr:DUF1489 domain-containing protein [Limimonas halophila]SDG48926.1 hypothetical protein SAMN05216241_11543 [Limimonas halophila]
MPLHLIKLCVGVESPDDLETRQASQIARAESATGRRFAWHVTRRTPRRAGEVLDGGSLYWVMNGAIRARQPLLDIRETTDSDGKPACVLELAPGVTPVQARPHRPFQGWRYIQPDQAPPDSAGDGDDESALPDAILAEMAERGFR